MGLVAAACAAFCASSAHADESPPATNPADPAPVQLEGIVVTLQRRAEPLSKAPLAASAITQATLDSQGMAAIADIPTTVPNLQLAGNGFALRGIGSNNSFGGYATVAVHIDGIYEPAYPSLSLGLYDIDRIEVLRGPQGTVYGRNATAGVVNIETAGPKPDFEAFADVAYGSGRDRTLRGVLNLPLGPQAQVRLSAMTRRNNGQVDGGPAARRYDEIDVSSLRLAWNWQISPVLRWRASLSRTTDAGTVPDTQRLSYTYFPDADLSTGTLGRPVVVAPGGDILAYHTSTDIAKDRSQQAFRSSLSWSLGGPWSISYLAGITRFVNDGEQFQTGIFELKNKDWITRAQSHEIDLRFESPRLTFVGGAYHFHDRTTGVQKISIGDAVAYPMSTALPPPVVIDAGQGTEPAAVGLVDVAVRNNGERNESNAVFTQFTWGFAPAWRGTAGLRHTRDRVSTNGDSQACAFGTLAQPNADLSCGFAFGPPSSSIASAHSAKTTGRLGVEHDLSAEQLLYAAVATGYRGGGATANVAPEFQTFRPETLTSVEAGWRGRLLDRRLGLSAAVFDMDYRDLQVTVIGKDNFGTNTPVTGNAGTARVRGLELEGDWLATRNDRLSGFLTWLDARFGTFVDPVATSFNPSAYNTFAAVPVPHVDNDNSGHRMPNAPRLALKTSYARTISLDTGARLVASAQLYWQSGTYTSLENFADPQRGYRRAYGKVDLGLRYDSADRRWSAEGYVYNLEDRKVYASAVPLHAVTTVSYQAPRTVGLRLGYRFD
jgi:iron complex outermembrane receptor protein